MKNLIFVRFILPAFLIMLIVSAAGAKGEKAEPVDVATMETTSTPLVTPTQSKQPSMVETTKDSRAGEEINWQVISGGGTIGGTSESFTISGTAGQTATGSGSSDNFGMSHGFWQTFGGSCCNLAGDANDDDAINVGDAVWMINYVFKGGPPPPCTDEGDANNDCALNVGDAVYLINYVFKGGPPPECGCVG